MNLLEERNRRIEDRQALRDLVHAYTFAMDNREALKGRGRMRANGDIRDADLPEGGWR